MVIWKVRIYEGWETDDLTLYFKKKKTKKQLKKFIKTNKLTVCGEPECSNMLYSTRGVSWEKIKVN